MTNLDLHELDIRQEGEIAFYSYNPQKFSNQGIALKKNMPVFYNPIQELNRSISLVVFANFIAQISKNSDAEIEYSTQKNPNNFREEKIHQKIVKICDVMSASGIRSLRLIKFLSHNVQFLINDLNPLALEFFRANAKLNNIELDNNVKTYNYDANLLFNLFRKDHNRPDIIDIDPFGSPNIFVENAVNCIYEGGLLALTATDTAVFFGVRKQTCQKKYNTRPLHSTFLKEVGLRILLYYVATRAHPFNKGIQPILSLSFDHYIRIFVQLNSGRHIVNKNLCEFGYILWCPQCDWRGETSSNVLKIHSVCPNCGQKVEYGGPLWIGNIHNQEFVKTTEQIATQTSKNVIPSKKRIMKVLKIVKTEDNFPLGYYDIHKLCDKLNLTTSSRDEIIEEIEAIGFKAQQTHINPKALKTDVPIDILTNILQKLSVNKLHSKN